MRYASVHGLGSNQAFHATLADGERGTAQTIGFIRQLVNEGMNDPGVRSLAVAILRNAGVNSHDEISELRAIYSWVQQNFHFRKDPIGREMLQPVRGILANRAGDCDDLNAILLATLVGSVGYPTRAVTIKADAEDPENFSHIYIEARLNDGVWVPLDLARPGATFGNAPEYFWDVKSWPLTAGANGQGKFMGAFPKFGAKKVFVKIRKRALGDLPDIGYGQMVDTSAADTSGFDWSSALNSILTATPNILKGTASIVQAANTPQYPYATTPYGTAPGVTVSAAGSTNWIVLGIIGIGIVFAASRFGK